LVIAVTMVGKTHILTYR